MIPLRTMLVACVAFSLAVLPVSAAEMRASMMTGMSDATTHAECCPKAGQCEKQNKNDCGKSGSCALMCSIMSATTVAGVEIIPPAFTVQKSAPVIDSLSSTLEHPPLPPPRV